MKTPQDVIAWMEGWIAEGAVLHEFKVQPYRAPSGYHEVTFKGRLLVPPEDDKKRPKGQKGVK